MVDCTRKTFPRCPLLNAWIIQVLPHTGGDIGSRRRLVARVSARKFSVPLEGQLPRRVDSKLPAARPTESRPPSTMMAPGLSQRPLFSQTLRCCLGGMAACWQNLISSHSPRSHSGAVQEQLTPRLGRGNEEVVAQIPAPPRWHLIARWSNAARGKPLCGMDWDQDKLYNCSNRCCAAISRRDTPVAPHWHRKRKSPAARFCYFAIDNNSAHLWMRGPAGRWRGFYLLGVIMTADRVVAITRPTRSQRER